MTSEERIRAAHHWFKSWECRVWAAHFPNEVPLINGELPWIALRSIDAE
ncbi:MAG TPA: hypothetical protein VFJ57_11965 [Solirubrobacterales bacterium]|nr:hypothetical protein [Solirubrobacterales bacterium]